ncbi:MAG TPA: 2TM domain-containing protein [Dehalococcoidia bacterium]
MTRDHDDFDGIDISGPWGGVRIGSGGARFVGGDWGDDDPEVRAIRRRVRQRMDLLRQIAYFIVIVGVLALIDGATGGGWWVQWVAIFWGAFLAFQFLGMFVTPMLWGREAEERMVERELAKRRGRVSVSNAPPPDDDKTGT